MRRWLLLLWVVLMVEAFFVAPPELPSTPGMLWRMLTFQWLGISPTLVALFWSVGVLWALYVSFLLTAPRQTQPHPAYAIAGSVLLGSFVLLPYLALRRHGPEHDEPRNAWLASPILRMALMSALITCLLFGILAGDLDLFWYEFTTRKLSHVIVLDFITMATLLPVVAAEKL